MKWLLIVIGAIAFLVFLQTLGLSMFDWAAQRQFDDRLKRVRHHRLAQPPRTTRLQTPYGVHARWEVPHLSERGKMKLRLDLAWLKQQHVFVATPQYNETCTTQHHLAILSLSSLLTQYGVTHHVSTHPDSLVTRARNRMVWSFLQGDYTHALFIDSDVHFIAGDVVHMLVLSQTHEGILGAPYAKKQINWAKVAEAAKRGVSEKDLAAIASDFVINWVEPPERIYLDRPTAIRELGTGYMLVPRKVFIDMIEKGMAIRYKLMPDEQAKYKTDHQYAFFLDPIDPETCYHLSEDWYFCRNWLKLGGKVWMCPWMRTRHIGSHEFVGDIVAVARAGGEI